MTITEPTTAGTRRVPTKRTVLMCRPDALHRQLPHQPWMHPEDPTDTSLAVRAVGCALPDLPRPRIRGAPHRPDRRPARHGLRRERRLRARRHRLRREASPTRSASPRVPRTWTGSATTASTCASPPRSTRARATSCSSATRILAGTGFRSASNSHEELAGIYGREVVSLQLINPSFYHLDTAIAVLDPVAVDGHANIAYLPSAFDEASPQEDQRAVPRRRGRERRGRGGARPQLLQRRLQRGHRVPREGLRAPAARARLQPHRRRPVASCSSAAAE